MINCTDKFTLLDNLMIFYSITINKKGISMRIGLLSDSHGNTTALKSALAILSDLDVEAIVHCGDI